jgi:hypothetical protein
VNSGPGEVLFVAVGEMHRLEDFTPNFRTPNFRGPDFRTSDFRMGVMFYGPVGGEKP